MSNTCCSLSKDYIKKYLNSEFCQNKKTHESVVNYIYYSANKSKFIHDSLKQKPSLIRDLFLKLKNRDHLNNYKKLNIKNHINNSINDEKRYFQELRYFHKLETLTIAVLDLNDLETIQQIVKRQSKLAEQLVLVAYAWCYSTLKKSLGTPLDKLNQELHMKILAMGKLGGDELNFSSDIDLIFCFPFEGITVGGKKSISHSEFFTRVGQKLISCLNQSTSDGYCYRVDMRLRPYGDSGALVYSFSALEEYYQSQGREWERYALVKAKILGENDSFSQKLRLKLLPFVFRKYIDFSIIDSLKLMKKKINIESKHVNNNILNIKLGCGGIREAEFIVQSFQLVRGGREEGLRSRNFNEALIAINKLKLLSDKETQNLKKSYWFLRQLENYLQILDNKQVHHLPNNEKEQRIIQKLFKFDFWENFLETLAFHTHNIHKIFQHIFGNEEDTNDSNNVFQNIWLLSDKKDVLNKLLLDLNQNEPNQITSIISNFKKSLRKKNIGKFGKINLDLLIPKSLQIILNLQISNKSDVLKRMFDILFNIVTRTTYLELLNKYNFVLEELINLVSKSTFVTQQITKYPILLDEILTTDGKLTLLNLEDYKGELENLSLSFHQDDFEQQMELLRQFKQSQIFKIVVSDLRNKIPLMKVSDHLTALAESIIHKVTELAWHQITNQYGIPSYLEGSSFKDFTIIGFGKLGGYELSYNSDLDLVFLSNFPKTSMTNGTKKISSYQFYSKLIQRIIHILSIKTSMGQLYDVDIRLRPSGKSGLLVCSDSVFLNYQINDAWLWEHQALIRARSVYSSAQTHSFDSLRVKVLCTKTHPKDFLKKEIVEMRKKVISQKDLSTKNIFDIKNGAYGLIDIEFFVQYMVLLFGREEKNLFKYTDNIRILEQLGQYNFISSDEQNNLINIYCTFRTKIHHMSLRNEVPSMLKNEAKIYRKFLKETWSKYLGKESLLPVDEF